MAESTIPCSVDGPRLMERVTLHVRIRREKQMRLRIWLAAQIIKLAVVVGGWGGIEFDE